MQMVRTMIAATALVAGVALPAAAYIGPGAGLSLLGAFWGLLLAVGGGARLRDPVAVAADVPARAHPAAGETSASPRSPAEASRAAVALGLRR